MPTLSRIHGFSAGELDPGFSARDDLEKYYSSAARLNNFFVETSGEIATRPGTWHVGEFQKNDGATPRMIPFTLGTGSDDTYMILMGNPGGQQLWRFAQNGDLVLNDELEDIPVTRDVAGCLVVNFEITAATLAARTAFVEYLSNAQDLFIITDRSGASPSSVTTEDYRNLVFTLNEVPTVADPNKVICRTGDTVNEYPRSSGGTISIRSLYTVYGFGDNFADENVTNMQFEQIYDSILMTCSNCTPTRLVRYGHRDWRLTSAALGEASVAGTIDDIPSERTTTIRTTYSATTGLGVRIVTDSDTDDDGDSVTDDNDAAIVYTVTAVDEAGIERVVTYPQLVYNLPNYAASAGSIRYGWDNDYGMASDTVKLSHYNIYRSQIYSTAKEVNRQVPLGFIGSTKANRFLDDNIAPDFTRQPPIHYNPFARGAITRVDIAPNGDTANSVVTNVDAVAVTAAGANSSGNGFLAHPIWNIRGSASDDPSAAGDPEGVIIGLDIINPGRNFVKPITFTWTKAGAAFTGPPNSTITAEVTATDSDELSPRCSRVYQQRQIYAGSKAKPLTLWGSQINKPDLFDRNPNATRAGSFELSVSDKRIAPIRYLVENTNGLAAFTDHNVYLVHGGEGKPISVLDNFADLQLSTGAGSVPPISVDNSIIFLNASGGALYRLTPQRQSPQFDYEDFTLLVKHLVTANNPITSMAYRGGNTNQLYCVREDGTMIVATLDFNESIIAFSTYWMRATYKAVGVVREDTRDRTYFIVERDGNLVLLREGVRERWKLGGEADGSEDIFHCLDDAESFTASNNQTVIQGLSRFAGERVFILQNDALIYPRNWRVGRPVTFEVGDSNTGHGLLASVPTLTQGAEIKVGLQYTCTVRTQRPVFDDMNHVDRFTTARRARVFYRRAGRASQQPTLLTTGSDPNHRFQESNVNTTGEWDQIRAIDVNLAHRKNPASDDLVLGQVEIRQNNPIPLSISGMVIEYEYDHDDVGN